MTRHPHPSAMTGSRDEGRDGLRAALHVGYGG